MDKEQNIKKLVEHYRVPFKKEKRIAWEELNNKLNSETKLRRISVSRAKWFSIAATFILVAFISTVLINNQILTKTHITADKQKIILLPEGSKVTLNPNSELKVKYAAITGKRKLELRGEALFDVEKGKPFIVKFPKGKVEVLGTIFVINAYSDKNPVINCIEGSVKVVVRKDIAVINSGKSARLAQSNQLKTNVIDTEKVISALNGNYSWNNTPLSEIFATIQNRFGCEISAESSIQKRNFTGKIALRDLKSTCDVISFALDLKYNINEDSKTIIFENIK